MLEPGHKAVRLIITGRVQGVWYRGWAVEQAGLLALDGWVRNRADGTVEALIAGPESQVDRMITKCRRGPKLAKVSHMDIQPAMGITPRGFIQKPTVDIDERRGL